MSSWPPGPQDPERLVDRLLRVPRVVEGLAEDRQVDRPVGEGHLLDVAELVGQVGQVVLARELGAHLDHPGRVVDAPDLLRVARQELRDQPLAGSQVRDDDLGHEPEREPADRLPRAPGAVVAAEAPGDHVEILLGDPPALREDPLQVPAVLLDHLEAGDAVHGGPQERELLGGRLGRSE